MYLNKELIISILFSYILLGDYMRKYKIIILLIVIILIFIFSCFVCSAKDLPLKNKIIFIDPGHGGNDPGATNKDIKESNINLQISLIISNLLKENGAIVYMTRYDNYNLSRINVNNIKRSDLDNRAKIINNSDCDLFISIHLNSYPSSVWHGAQTFYTNKNPNNIKLATIIQKNLKKNTDTTRDIKLITDRYLYNKITKPGVLIELGFISNLKEKNQLLDKKYQYNLSNIIVNSIIEYYR